MSLRFCEDTVDPRSRITPEQAPGLRFRRLADFENPRRSYVELVPTAAPGVEPAELHAGEARTAVLEAIYVTPDTAPHFGGGDSTWRIVLQDFIIHKTHTIILKACEVGGEGRVLTLDFTYINTNIRIGLFDGHVLILTNQNANVVTCDGTGRLAIAFIEEPMGKSFIDTTSTPPTLLVVNAPGSLIHRCRGLKYYPRANPRPFCVATSLFTAVPRCAYLLYGFDAREYRCTDARGRLWLYDTEGCCTVRAPDFTVLHILELEPKTKPYACLDEGLVFIDREGVKVLVDIPDEVAPDSGETESAAQPAE